MTTSLANVDSAPSNDIAIYFLVSLCTEVDLKQRLLIGAEQGCSLALLPVLP